MGAEDSSNQTRRSILRKAAGAAVVGGAATGLASGATAIDVTAKIYPGGSGRMRKLTMGNAKRVKRFLDTDLAGQFRELGLNLETEIVNQLERFESREDFENNLDETYRTGGYAIHIWLPTLDTYPSTVNHVNGDGEDAFVRLPIQSVTREEGYDRNIVIHEVCHAFMDEQYEGFACSREERNNRWSGTEVEHNCGNIRPVDPDAAEPVRSVSPMATSYHETVGDLPALCEGTLPGDANYAPDEYHYTQTVSSCTRNSMQAFVDNQLRPNARRDGRV